MAYCYNCGAKITSELKFCESCGAELGPRYAPRPAIQETIVEAPVEDVPYEATVREGTMNEYPSTRTMWFLAVCMVILVIEGALILPGAISEGEIASPVQIALCFILCIIAIRLIYRRAVQRIARAEIKNDGVHVGSIDLLKGLVHSKPYLITFDRIGKVQKTIGIDGGIGRFGKVRGAFSTHNLILYLNNGKIVSFLMRDPEDVRLAEQVLVQRYHIRDKNKDITGNGHGVYGTYTNKRSWKNDWPIFALQGFLIAWMLVYLVCYFLVCISDTVTGSQTATAGMFSVAVVLLTGLSLMLYSQYTVRTVEIRKDGVMLGFKKNSRYVPWDAVFSIDSTMGMDISRSKKMFSVLRLKRTRAYKLDHDIGDYIRAAFKESTGRTAPSDMPLSYSRPLSSSEDRQYLLETRPDLIRNERSVQAATLILVVFILVVFVLGSLILLLVLLAWILILRRNLKKNSKEMKRVIDQHKIDSGIERKKS